MVEICLAIVASVAILAIALLVIYGAIHGVVAGFCIGANIYFDFKNIAVGTALSIILGVIFGFVGLVIGAVFSIFIFIFNLFVRS